jgi:hypothetical protein
MHGSVAVIRNGYYHRSMRATGGGFGLGRAAAAVSVLLALAVAAPAAAGAPTFTGPTPFVAGSFPNLVIAADLNGDGRPELVTANANTNGAAGNTVLTNTTAPGAATPSFTGPTPFNAFLRPYHVTAADLNADGRPDLVTANNGNGGVNGTSVLTNTTPAGAATPTFSGPTPFAAGTEPTAVAAADFNGDGRLDLATSNSEDAAGITVLVNTTTAGAAAPSFTGPTPFAAGDRPWSLAAPDVNRDGRPDLVTANAGSDGPAGVSVLLNTTAPGAGSPSFANAASFSTGAFPLAVTATDLDGDRKLDLVTANNGSNGNSVLVNTTPAGATTPSFAGPIAFPAGNGPYSVTAADLNSDGKPDLVTANSNTTGSSGNTVLINVTEPGEELPAFDGPTAFTAGNTPVSVAAADLNGDGRPDLATANNQSDNNTVLLNTTPFPFTAGPSTLAFGSQPSGTISVPQTITLGNSTAATLPVAVRLTGDVDDMLISHNSCGDGVPADGSCTVAIRFAPSAAGPRAATLTLDPAGPQSTEVELTGSGGGLPQGPAGATGPTGATGATGATGPTGRPGRDARVRCTVAKPKKGSRRTRVTCRVTYLRARSTTWRLVRAGRTRASGRLRAETATLRFGRLAPGRYTLRVGGRPVVTFRVRRT